MTGPRSLVDLLAAVVDDAAAVWPAEVVDAAETVLDRVEHAQVCRVCKAPRLDAWLAGEARRALRSGPACGELSVLVELAAEVERRPRRCAG